MMTKRKLLLALVGLPTLGLAGCGDDRPPAPKGKKLNRVMTFDATIVTGVLVTGVEREHLSPGHVAGDPVVSMKIHTYHSSGGSPLLDRFDLTWNSPDGQVTMPIDELPAAALARRELVARGVIPPVAVAPWQDEDYDWILTGPDTAPTVTLTLRWREPVPQPLAASR